MKKRKPGILKLYSIERDIIEFHYGQRETRFDLLALVTERNGVVSEVDPFMGDPWYLKKCEGWQWDAFLVYCKAKGLSISTLGAHLDGEFPSI